MTRFRGCLVVFVLLGWPTVHRWLSADRSVARERLRFGRVERGDLVHTVAVEGRVVAASRPTLYSSADGIVSLQVAEGQRVAQGDVLAVVESPELESRLRQERAIAEALVAGEQQPSDCTVMALPLKLMFSK